MTSDTITDIKAFAETCTEDELFAYGLSIKTGKTFDYTKPMWGKTVTHRRNISKFVNEVNGFYMRLIGIKPPSKGDTLLCKAESGLIKNFLILDIKYRRDPEDMFDAYVVCYTD
jgi:hypothetical protein